MDRRLLGGLIVLGVAVLVGVGVLVFGGGDDSDGSTTDTTSALSNDERPLTTADNTTDDGDGNKDGKGNEGGNGGDDSGATDTGSNSGSDNGATDNSNGPPIEQDPTGGGKDGNGGNQNEGDPTQIAAVTDTLTSYLESIYAGDGSGACEELSPTGVVAMQKKVAVIAPETRGSPCEQTILLYQGAYGTSAKSPKFKSIKVSGSTATAVGPLKEPAKLSLSGDGWLIDDYGQ